MINFLILIAGLIVLVFSGDWLVRGGVSLAKRFQISPMVIGITIISLGTSAPELVVSINAALSGHPDISIGNVIGSNIANIALVLGVTALIIKIPVKKKTIWFDWSVMVLASLLFFVFGQDLILSRVEGLTFMVLLVAYILLSLFSERMGLKRKPEEEKNIPLKTFPSILIITVSIAGLIFGSKLLVKGAENIAFQLGVSERVISISVIAFGTSVPELATSIMAAIRKELDISIGNLIGSNIFNLFGILGTTAVVTDIPINQASLDFDWLWMLGIFIVLFVFMQPVKRSKIVWWEGLTFIAIYFTYYYLIYTN